MNTSYQYQLRKMFIIETIGEKLYKALSLKIKDEKLKSIYQQLAVNEAQTAKYIEQELARHNKNPTIVKKLTAHFSGFIFTLLTAKQINWILKNTLKKRIYQRWFNIYNGGNPNLWSRLLKHEEFQHKLLKL